MSEKKNRYIVLGSGIAGMAAAEAIREHDGTADILMISAEKELCFNRPMLIGEFALDGSGAALFGKQQEWPAQFGVQVRQGMEVTAIDREAKTVRMRPVGGEASGGGDRGKEATAIERYDKLIYALGAEAAVPPIPGTDRDSVFVVRTREDMRRIREAMSRSKFAVVIGGGMLGLEDAWAMRMQKLDVSVIERRQRLAFEQIDQSAGNLMKKRVERMGVPVYLNAEVTEIGDGYVTFRQPAEAADELVTIPADMVILSVGVTPNSKPGEAAGLEVVGSVGDCMRNFPRWIAVDEYCRTSDPDIFAAGDCAAVNGRSDAIWDEARQMGRVAGANAAVSGNTRDAADSGNNRDAADSGNSRELPSSNAEHLQTYIPVVPEHVFTGFDTEVFTMADSSGAGTDGVYIRHADVEIFDYQRERYIRVSLQDGSIAGILLINAPELAPELMEAYRAGAGEEEARQIIRRWKDSHEVDFKPAEPFRKR